LDVTNFLPLSGGDRGRNQVAIRDSSQPDGEAWCDLDLGETLPLQSAVAEEVQHPKVLQFAEECVNGNRVNERPFDVNQFAVIDDTICDIPISGEVMHADARG